MPKTLTTPSKSTTKSPSKPPSTPKKPRTYAVWRSPIAAPNTAPLATATGPSIKRTEATRKYKIKATDLDTITPISRQPNHMGGSTLIQVYNECDVRALTQRIRPGKPLPAPEPMASAVVLAMKNGPRIMRTTAMREFKLTPAQIDQLNPVSASPNAYGTVTKYYNRCDVEKLKLQLEQLGPAGLHAAFD